LQSFKLIALLLLLFLKLLKKFDAPGLHKMQTNVADLQQQLTRTQIVNF